MFIRNPTELFHQTELLLLWSVIGFFSRMRKYLFKSPPQIVSHNTIGTQTGTDEITDELGVVAVVAVCPLQQMLRHKTEADGCKDGAPGGKPSIWQPFPHEDWNACLLNAEVIARSSRWLTEYTRLSCLLWEANPGVAIFLCLAWSSTSPQ